MIPIKVPPLGESIVEATVAKWLKNEGDSVAQGEALVEMQRVTSRVQVVHDAFAQRAWVRRASHCPQLVEQLQQR